MCTWTCTCICDPPIENRPSGDALQFSVRVKIHRQCYYQWTLFRNDIMGGKVGTKWRKYMKACMFYTTLFRDDAMGGKVGTKWRQFMKACMFCTWKHENMHVLLYFLPISPPPPDILAERGLFPVSSEARPFISLTLFGSYKKTSCLVHVGCWPQANVSVVHVRR